jgi:predicted RNA methylase
MTAKCDHQGVERQANGSWVCRRCKAEFKSDPWDRFYTSHDQAELMVELAIECGLGRGHRVLEPSAGRGALVKALPHWVSVTAVEAVSAEAAQIRRAEGADQTALEVEVADFLRWTPAESTPFELGLMNPPYSSTDGADGLHVARALRWCDSVIALLRTNFLHGFGRYHGVFRWAELTHMIVLSRRPSFDGPADNGLGARHEYSIFRLKRRAAERQPYQSDTPIVRFVP